MDPLMKVLEHTDAHVATHTKKVYLPRPDGSACGHSRLCGQLEPAAVKHHGCSSTPVSGEQTYPSLNY